MRPGLISHFIYPAQFKAVNLKFVPEITKASSLPSNMNAT